MSFPGADQQLTPHSYYAATAPRGVGHAPLQSNPAASMQARRARNVHHLQGFSGRGLALTGSAGRLAAQSIAGGAERFDTFARIRPYPDGRLLRTPALRTRKLYYRLKDML